MNPADGESEILSSSDLLVDQWSKERPDIDMFQFGILLRIRALGMLMDQFGEAVSKQLGLKSSEMYLLYALRRGGKPYRMRPTDIFKLLKVTSGTITYRLDSLEECGLVVRLPDPQDRRSVVIQLTPKGKRLVDKSVDITSAKFKDKLASVIADPTEAAAFMSVLRKLGVMYDEAMSGADNPLIHTIGANRKRA